MNILEKIRAKTREQWSAYVLECWTDLRIWLQENGELAALICFVGGIFFVLAFKLVVTILVLLLIVAFAAWQYALPEQQSKGADRKDPPNVNGHSN